MGLLGRRHPTGSGKFAGPLVQGVLDLQFGSRGSHRVLMSLRCDRLKIHEYTVRSLWNSCAHGAAVSTLLNTRCDPSDIHMQKYTYGGFLFVIVQKLRRAFGPGRVRSSTWFEGGPHRVLARSRSLARDRSATGGLSRSGRGPTLTQFSTL